MDFDTPLVLQNYANTVAAATIGRPTRWWREMVKAAKAKP